MKNQIVILAVSVFLLLLMSCSGPRMTVQVPPNDVVEVNFDDFDNYEATIKNKSGEGVDIKVMDNANNEQTSGFGLNKKSKAKVAVSEGETLVFKNNSNSVVRARVKVKVADNDENRATKKVAIEDPMEGGANQDRYITFTLRNNTAKSIPLIIPSVMNPNLSPFSNSGVSLQIGQKIYFKTGRKKRLLLTVDNTIKEGEILDVAKRIKRRKEELGM